MRSIPLAHPTVAAALAILCGTSPAAAQEGRVYWEPAPARLVGCYAFSITTWHRGALDGRRFRPPSMRLEAVHGTDTFECGQLLVRTPSGERLHRERAWWHWRPIGSDSVEVLYSDGFTGVDMVLRAVGDTLRGTATAFRDVVDGTPDPTAEVTAVRIPCPRPVSPAIPHGLSRGLVQLDISSRRDTMALGDTMRLAARGAARNGRTVSAPRVQWISSDTLVATVDSTGAVRPHATGAVSIVARTRDATARLVLHVVPVRFVSLAAGFGRTCGVSRGGALYCWGGTSPFEADHLSADVPARMFDTFAFDSVSVALDHACGLTRRGAAYCWGSADDGELGSGEFISQPEPVPVQGGLVFAQISAGMNFTCGRTREGAAYCWGRDENGQLGTDRPAEHSWCRGLGNPVACATLPVRVDVPPLIAISAGAGRACGVTTTGAALCWPVSDTATRHVPGVPGGASDTLRFTQISTSGTHTCALTGDGRAYCWGNNEYGQLGNGTRDTATAPVPVAGHIRFARIVATGANSTCALTASGALYCWGRGDAGQIPVTRAPLQQCSEVMGAVPCDDVPRRASTPLRFVSLAPASLADQECALTADGLAYCWGGAGSGVGNARACGQASPPLPVGGRLEDEEGLRRR